MHTMTTTLDRSGHEPTGSSSTPVGRDLSARAGAHLPDPPTDDEAYSYVALQRRWPFVWLFLAQATLVYAFVVVVAHSPTTWLALVLLTFLVPPLVVNLWLRTRPRRMDLEDHMVVRYRWRRRRESWPTVDVFLPVRGEEPAVLANTFHHVSALEWPGRLQVHVLDDVDDADTARLAAEHGFSYVVRPHRGEWQGTDNLTHALEHTHGELIAVFDADSAPRADFLHHTVPYLADERFGLVQTAPYFDVDPRVNEFARFASVLHELFFRWMQPSRDNYDAASCAGTSVVYRRVAVEAAGGFGHALLGEDVHSGVKLSAAGYRTWYLPLALAKGLAPDTWEALTHQQYQRCRSSLLLMVSSSFREAPFSWRQRVCFWAASLYYLSSAAMVLGLALPLAIVLWFHPEGLQETPVLAVVPALLSTWLVLPLLARGWSPAIYRVEMINSLCHLLAVVDAVRDRVAASLPTRATSRTSRKPMGTPRRVALTARTWFVLAQLAVWGGVASYLWAGHPPSAVVPVVLLWGLQVWLLLPVVVRLAPTPRISAVLARRTRSST